MRVGVLCEFSGVARDAFIARGHDAISCDLLPTEAPGPHIQGDCLAQDWSGFDLLICHPPCTHLSVSGAAHFAAKRADGRQQAAIDFFMAMTRLPCPRIVIENPVCIMSRLYRKPDQIIQPWQFGHAESKATCLWLIGVPLLVPTEHVDPMYACRCGCRFNLSLGKYGCPNCNGDMGEARMVYRNQTPSGQNKLGPSPARAKLRAKTYAGIARAFADQWGSLPPESPHA